MRVIEFAFPKMYSTYKAQEISQKFEKGIFDLYDEYVDMASSVIVGTDSSINATSSIQGRPRASAEYWDDLDQHCGEIESNEPYKSELVDYLDKPHQSTQQNPKDFNYLDW